MGHGKHISNRLSSKVDMSDGGLSDLFRAVGYVGTVKAVRQDYQVFRTVVGDFLVFSSSNRGSMAFHMTRWEPTRWKPSGK